MLLVMVLVVALGMAVAMMMRRSNDRGSLTLPQTSNFGVGLKITTNLIVGVLPPFVFF